MKRSPASLAYHLHYFWTGTIEIYDFKNTKRVDDDKCDETISSAIRRLFIETHTLQDVYSESTTTKMIGNKMLINQIGRWRIEREEIGT